MRIYPTVCFYIIIPLCLASVTPAASSIQSRPTRALQGSNDTVVEHKPMSMVEDNSNSNEIVKGNRVDVNNGEDKVEPIIMAVSNFTDSTNATSPVSPDSLTVTPAPAPSENATDVTSTPISSLTNINDKSSNVENDGNRNSTKQEGDGDGNDTISSPVVIAGSQGTNTTVPAVYGASEDGESLRSPTLSDSIGNGTEVILNSTVASNAVVNNIINASPAATSLEVQGSEPTATPESIADDNSTNSSVTSSPTALKTVQAPSIADDNSTNSSVTSIPTSSPTALKTLQAPSIADDNSSNSSVTSSPTNSPTALKTVQAPSIADDNSTNSSLTIIPTSSPTALKTVQDPSIADDNSTNSSVTSSSTSSPTALKTVQDPSIVDGNSANSSVTSSPTSIPTALKTVQTPSIADVNSTNSLVTSSPTSSPTALSEASGRRPSISHKSKDSVTAAPSNKSFKNDKSQNNPTIKSTSTILPTKSPVLNSIRSPSKQLPENNLSSDLNDVRDTHKSTKYGSYDSKSNKFQSDVETPTPTHSYNTGSKTVSPVKINSLTASPTQPSFDESCHAALSCSDCFDQATIVYQKSQKEVYCTWNTNEKKCFKSNPYDTFECSKSTSSSLTLFFVLSLMGLGYVYRRRFEQFLPWMRYLRRSYNPRQRDKSGHYESVPLANATDDDWDWDRPESTDRELGLSSTGIHEEKYADKDDDDLQMALALSMQDQTQGQSLSNVDSWDESIPSPNHSPNLQGSNNSSVNSLRISSTTRTSEPHSSKTGNALRIQKNVLSISTLTKPHVSNKPRDDDIFASMGIAASTNRRSTNSNKSLPSASSRWVTSNKIPFAPARTITAPAVAKASDLLTNENLDDADWGDDHDLDDLDNF